MPNPNYSILVWGAISKKGIIALAFIDKTMDQAKYINTLSNYLLPNADKIHGKNKWRFQQDNAPCHKAYSVKQWLGANSIRMLDHPPQSPDLNPIENVWGIIKKSLEKKKSKNKIDLTQNIKESWNKISKEICANCIDHLIKTLSKVIEKEGKFIK